MPALEAMRTHVQRRTLAPNWEKECRFRADGTGRSIVVTVYHAESDGRPDRPLGQAVLAVKGGGGVPDQWVSLKDSGGRDVRGADGRVALVQLRASYRSERQNAGSPGADSIHPSPYQISASVGFERDFSGGARPGVAGIGGGGGNQAAAAAAAVVAGLGGSASKITTPQISYMPTSPGQSIRGDGSPGMAPLRMGSPQPQHPGYGGAQQGYGGTQETSSRQGVWYGKNRRLPATSAEEKQVTSLLDVSEMGFFVQGVCAFFVCLPVPVSSVHLLCCARDSTLEAIIGEKEGL